MKSLSDLNADFNTTINEDDIENLATDIWCDLLSKSQQPNSQIERNDLHGIQAFELFAHETYNKLMKQFFIKDLLEDIAKMPSPPEVVESTRLQALLSKGIANLVAAKLVPTAKISETMMNETMTAGAGGTSSIESAAPEHTIEVVNGEESKILKEQLQERIALRKQLNEITDESIRIRNLKEKAEDDSSDYSQLRYKLQVFKNGGTPYIDENGTPQIDGEKDGPSSYEAWRAGLNNKKRAERITQEKADRESIFASPRHTTPEDPKTVLDNQSDAFLAWFLDKFKE
jgi:hypothetical protein